MSYFFATPVDIDIVLEDADDRSMVDVKLDKNRREKAPLYMDGESVKGAVTVRPKDGKRLEHTGIKVQFIGTIGTARMDRIAWVGRGRGRESEPQDGAARQAGDSRTDWY